MSLGEALTTGVTLTAAGMGLVFLLLTLLWGLLALLLRLDRPPVPAGPPPAEAAPAPPAPAGASRPTPELLGAIAVAVLTHRAILRKQAAPPMRSHWPGSLLYASRWVAMGRHQQTQSWHPRKR